MKISLVHPAGSNFVPGKKDISAIANRMAPIGILSIAACLEKHGHKVHVHDCLGPGAPAGIEKNCALILRSSPELAGFSATTSSFPDAYSMAQLLKEKMPGLKIIFGGVHASALGEKLMQDYPLIDMIVVGEGETPMLERASGKNPGEINGLIWRDGPAIRRNPPAVPISDLDSLPFPAYEKLPGFPKKYNLPLFNYINYPGGTMITSRGCVYECSYCDRSVFKKSYRSNSAEYIYEHMKYLRDRFGVRHINIYDDLFTANRKRISALCSMLYEKPLDLMFNCAVRAGYCDDELLSMLKKAGCLMVSIGIESGDPEQLKRHKAGVTIEQLRESVANIKKHGLRVKGLFIMGLPGDTEESIAATCDLAIQLDLDEMNMTKFTPFPGAPVWNSIREEGDFIEDWRLMNCLNFVFLPREIESFERIEFLYNSYVKRYYSHPAWRRRLRRRLWQHRHSLWYLLKNLPSFLTARRHFDPDFKK